MAHDMQCRTDPAAEPAPCETHVTVAGHSAAGAQIVIGCLGVTALAIMSLMFVGFAPADTASVHAGDPVRVLDAIPSSTDTRTGKQAIALD